MSKFTAKIAKIKKNINGDITDVMMDDGNIHTIEEAIVMAKHHIIEEVKIKQDRNGANYLISDPNGDFDITKLPKF